MARMTAGSVVVGYDGSAHAGAAVDWAAAEAARRGVDLHVVYAGDYPGLLPGPVGASPWLPEHALQLPGGIAAQGVERAAKTAPETRLSSVSVVGSAAGVLVQESRDAGLLVVGTRGHGALAGALLGSVAFAVSAHASCPVVVVRGSGTDQPDPQHPVVVGVDGSAAADSALRFAARAAVEKSAELVVAAAWHIPASETWELAYAASARDTEAFGATARTAAEDVTLRAEASALAAHPALLVRREVVGGPAGQVLADLSAAAGMVVVGARGRGGFTGLLLGSVSHAVIHRAGCPVAVVRA